MVFVFLTFAVETFICNILPYICLCAYEEILIPHYLHLTSPTGFPESAGNEAVRTPADMDVSLATYPTFGALIDSLRHTSHFDPKNDHEVLGRVMLFSFALRHIREYDPVPARVSILAKVLGSDERRLFRLYRMIVDLPIELADRMCHFVDGERLFLVQHRSRPDLAFTSPWTLIRSCLFLTPKGRRLCCGLVLLSVGSLITGTRIFH